jgi:hypothetical protein
VLQALRYVRGRVHHQWADAIEARDDVVMPLAWLHIRPGEHPVFEDSPPYTDWCWKQVEQLPPADNPRYERGIDQYRTLLSGEPVRQAIRMISDNLIVPVWTRAGGKEWPPLPDPARS